METRETRAIQTAIQIRSQPNSPPKIGGYAAVFNQAAVITDRSGRKFREVVRPGAFRDALASGKDIVAYYEHRGDRLARSKAKTLTLWEDSVGLAFDLEPPEDYVGVRIVNQVRRQEVEGASFGWNDSKSHWDYSGDMPTCELTSVDLIEISLTATPYYEGTTVSIRSQIVVPDNLWKYKNEMKRLELRKY